MNNELVTIESAQLELGMEVKLRNYGVKRRRKERGLTQKELGAHFGVSGCLIASIESFRARPSDEIRDKLAAFFGCSPQQIWPDWMNVMKETSSTSVAMVGDREVQRLSAGLERKLLSVDQPVQAAQTEEMKAAIAKAIDKLNSREADIIRRRFGIGFSAPQTLEEISKVHKVQRERIRQLEAKALRKLQYLGTVEELAPHLPDSEIPEYMCVVAYRSELLQPLEFVKCVSRLAAKKAVADRQFQCAAYKKGQFLVADVTRFYDAESFKTYARHIKNWEVLFDSEAKPPEPVELDQFEVRPADG